MKRTILRFLLVFSASLIFVTSVYAEVKFDYGASFRLRQEIWDDVVTLGTSDQGAAADRNFLRLRSSLWGSMDYEQKAGAYVRFTNEMFWYGLGPFKPAENSPSQPGGASGFYAGELIFDNLYADGNNIFGLPVDLRIGRQDFLGPNVYGEGFIFMDGTPGDGSRTFYFNAFKARVRFTQSASLDLMYISDPKYDEYLPSLYEGNKVQLCGSNEQAFVAYGRIKLDSVALEPYYVYKTEQPIAPNQQLRLNTAGARIAASPAGGWNLGIEGAYQWGNYDSGSRFNDRRGYGGYAFVGRKYEDLGLKPEWDLRYIYLSGDNVNTKNRNETWDPLFSRNPYWNELIIYTLIPETTQYGGPIPGYWTNMEILKASLKLNFSQDTSFTGSLQYLWAPQRTAGLPPSMFTNSGHERGFLPTALLSHRFTKSLDGFLQLEYFVPKDFYNSKDNATFFRWQLQYKI